MQQISTLQAKVDQLNAIIEEKDQIILNHNRARFGQSSEKRTYLLADGQLSMFEQAGDGITEKSADEANSKQKAVSVMAHTRKPKRKADYGMIALCGWAASPWLFFDLIPLDDAYNPTGFNRCPGSETPGLGKPYEKAYPTNE
jgi:hypothetical protein